MEFDDLIGEIVQFRDERDWAQFHKPHHLASAMAIEAAELQEAFLWKSPSEVEDFVNSPDGRTAVEEELADVLIFALLFAHETNIDPTQAIRSKLKTNAQKYPADMARGRSDKYTDL